MADIKHLKKKIIIDIGSKKLSEVLLDVLELAEKANNTQLKQLCIDELYGYEKYSAIPKYRYIPVNFHDKFGNLISRYPKGSTLTLNEIMQKEYFPYRGTIEDMENLTLEREIRGFIVLSEPYLVKFEDKEYKAYSFEHIPREVKSNILKLKKIIIKSVNLIEEKETTEDNSYFLENLHENIIKTSLDLFNNGHYRQAVLDATINLIEEVKSKSSLNSLDNTPLIQKAFSPNNPSLKISENKDLQLGFMWLFSGAIMTFRNVNAHRLNSDMTKDECIEQLYFLSYLFKTLDKAQRLTNNA